MRRSGEKRKQRKRLSRYAVWRIMYPMSTAWMPFGLTAGAFAGRAIVAGSVVGGLVWAFIRLFGDRENGGLPSCEEGKCHSWADYECLLQDGDAFFKCRCGHRYLMRSGSQFFKIVDDGSTAPYLKRHFGGRWRPDRSSSLGTQGGSRLDGAVAQKRTCAANPVVSDEPSLDELRSTEQDVSDQPQMDSV
jgi:hypothetical protein